MNLIHSVYREETQILFPKSETFYFTILRDTASQWASIYTWFRISEYFDLTSNYETMIQFMEEYQKLNQDDKLKLRWPQNPNFIDFGYRNKSLNSDEEIKNAISEFDSVFDFVMITELWEESILLLKNKLNLDFDDIVVFNVNVRIENSPNIPKGIIKEIRSFNKADQMLYNYFYKKLKIEAKTLDKKDFQILRSRKVFWENICIEGREIKTAYSNRKYLGYKLKNNISSKYKSKCEDLVRSELEFIQLFRKK